MNVEINGGGTPSLAMPIVHPPAAGQDAVEHYAAIDQLTSFDVATNHPHQLTVVVSNQDFAPLYAMTAGLVRYIPEGDPLPTDGTESAPQGGALALEIDPATIRHLRQVLPPGLWPMHTVLYIGVDANSVESAMQDPARVQPEDWLWAAWDGDHTPDDLSEIESRYVERFMEGTAAITTWAGMSLGDAALVDPTGPGADRGFILAFASSKGSDLSPHLKLRAMSTYAGWQWEQHPLETALADLTTPVDFYVRFEVWNPLSGQHEPLVGSDIALMRRRVALSPAVIESQTTRNDGTVHFHFENLEDIAGRNPTLHFRVTGNHTTPGGVVLPDEWATDGWLAADGRSPAYFENFSGTRVGNADEPFPIRVGVDYHAQFVYSGAPDPPAQRSGCSAPPRSFTAPRGVPVKLRSSTGWGPIGNLDHEDETDAEGSVQGVAFEVPPAADLSFRISLTLSDPSINLPHVQVHKPIVRSPFPFPLPGTVSLGDWRSDADQVIETEPRNNRTSWGAPEARVTLQVARDEYRAALYALKVAREWATFMTHMTRGEWAAPDDLRIVNHTPQEAFAWPPGYIWLPPRRHWARRTILHELGHQVMWGEMGHSAYDIAKRANILNELKAGWGWQELHLTHQIDWLYNEYHALLEGWAEFVAQIFVHCADHPPYALTDQILDAQGDPVQVDSGPSTLGNLPPNSGLKISAAFANGLWSIFWFEVVSGGGSPAADIGIADTSDGEIDVPWWMIDAEVRNRFESMLWEPLKHLATVDDPTTGAFISRIEENNPDRWGSIRQLLQQFNIATDEDDG